MRVHRCGKFGLAATDSELQRIGAPTAVGLGNFDGVHLGHRMLIGELIRRSGAKGLKSVIYTFDIHPLQLLPTTRKILSLMDDRQKNRILAPIGVDMVCYDHFDTAYANMSPEEFVRTVLIGRLNAKIVVAGFNYRFGHHGAGTAEQLVDFGKRFGFTVIIIPPYRINGIEVSSTYIRSMLEEGRVREIPNYLGRLYTLDGMVQPGLKKGRSIGIPTANLVPNRQRMVPEPGVYITSARIGKEREIRRSLTSIGNNPTVGVLREIVIETYILGFEQEIYETEIEIFFHDRIRGVVKFDSMEALQAQIKRDVVRAEQFFM